MIYEGLFNLVMFFVLRLRDRITRENALLHLYLASYAFFRFWLEFIRLYPPVAFGLTGISIPLPGNPALVGDLVVETARPPGENVARWRDDRMKRQVYTTARERRTDQIVGFIAFPIVNFTLWYVIDRLLVSAIAPRSIVLLLPWIVNGAVLGMAFLFRPQMGVGYIAWPGLMCLPTIACSPCLAACFVPIAQDLFRHPSASPLAFFLILGAVLEVSLLLALGIAAQLDRSEQTK